MTPDAKRVLALRIFRYACLSLLVIWPWFGGTFVLLGDANQALIYVIVGASLVLLTGWVGQISLAQASFVGIGAFSTATVAKSLHLGWPLNMIVAGLAAGVAASLLGLVALRVRGLYLAVATLIVAWMCDTYLFLTPWFGGGGAVEVKAIPVGVKGTFPYFDYTNRRTFYYIVLAVAIAVIFALTNLRDSKTGRAFFALKGSEVAAASMGVNVTRYKLLAFGLSGFIAGMAGSLTAVNLGALTPAQFRFTVSFLYLAIPVVGGLRSLSGTVAAAAVFGVMWDIFARFTSLNGWFEIVSAVLLMAVLLVYPGGLAALPAAALRRLRPVLDSLERRWLAWEERAAERRAQAMAPAGLALAPVAPMPADPEPGRAPAPAAVPAAAPTTSLGSRFGLRRQATADLLPLSAFGMAGPTAPAVAPSAAPSDEVRNDLWTAPCGPGPDGPRDSRRPVLEANGITVRFGGLTAVNGVSLEVREREIVGLIGPNGAGKTTLFNAIAGLNSPAAGSVHIFGRDATKLPVHARARLGVGRTFQAIQLVTELSVFDNLLVATHLQNKTGFLAHMAVTQDALVEEDRSRELVTRIVDLLDLGDVARRPVGGLPFGTLRMVEVARALATRSPLIMLDEPASGLDNTETRRLSDLLLRLRSLLGVSILLIEHDVEMVTSVCDHMYVVDRGNLIADGPTATVQRDPRVVAAYLGEAIEDQAEVTI